MVFRLIDIYVDCIELCRNCGFIKITDRDVIEAVEAFSFLVSVQGGAGGSDGLAAESFRVDIEEVAQFAVLYVKKAGGYVLLPGGLDETPARFGFFCKVSKKGRVLQLEYLVCEDDFARTGAVILGVELDRKGAVIDDVEGVYDVVESVFHGG